MGKVLTDLKAKLQTPAVTAYYEKLYPDSLVSVVADKHGGPPFVFIGEGLRKCKAKAPRAKQGPLQPACQEVRRRLINGPVRVGGRQPEPEEGKQAPRRPGEYRDSHGRRIVKEYRT